MRLMTWILSCLLLCSCSSTYKIEIPKPPCLYPFVDYDFTLCQPFVYILNDKVLFVPMGFTTDLASVPRFLWSIYSPNKANTIPAAIIHDYLYFCPGNLSRSEADAIFYSALIYKNVGVITAYKYWASVRLFGRSHFEQNAVCSYSEETFKNSIGHCRERMIDYA